MEGNDAAQARQPRPPQAPPLPRQQGAGLPLVLAPRRDASANELAGFRFPQERRHGPVNGGAGVMAAPGLLRENRAGGGRREENQRCGSVCAVQRLPLLFVAASSLAYWFLWSCFSNFIPNQPFKASCTFSHRTKPCHAFKYLTKCFRGSGQQKQYLRYFPLAIFFFFFFLLCVFIPILKSSVFTCWTV